MQPPNNNDLSIDNAWFYFEFGYATYASMLKMYSGFFKIRFLEVEPHPTINREFG